MKEVKIVNERISRYGCISIWGSKRTNNLVRLEFQLLMMNLLSKISPFLTLPVRLITKQLLCIPIPISQSPMDWGLFKHLFCQFRVTILLGAWHLWHRCFIFENTVVIFQNYNLYARNPPTKSISSLRKARLTPTRIPTSPSTIA